MEEGDWCEMKPANQWRVLLYASKLKDDIDEMTEESDGQKLETDKFEMEYDNMVNRIITERYLVIH